MYHLKFSVEEEELVETSVENDILPEKGILHRLILWNDDFNTFEHVIACLIRFIKKSYDEASEIAFIVHTKGKCLLLEAQKQELVELYHILVMKGLTVTLE